MYDGIDGFLSTRASIMLDVVFLAMFLVIPVMGWSIYQVKFRQKYDLHKKVQLSLGIVLLITVGLFEVDMQIFTDWEKRADPSPYYEAATGSGAAMCALWVHLCFAVTTAVIWIYVIVQALRKFPKPPVPCEYSPIHVRWARIAAIDMSLTAVTGWIFYYLAFVA